MRILSDSRCDRRPIKSMRTRVESWQVEIIPKHSIRSGFIEQPLAVDDVEDISG
jgi:hypothetical protein